MTKDLTVGSPFRVIIGYMIPVFFSLLLQDLYAVVDTAIVGQTLGENALGGVSSTGHVYSITVGACRGLCSGFCIPIANAFGAEDYTKLRRCVLNGAYLCAGATVLLLVFIAPNSYAILTAMQTPEENFPFALAYLRVMLWGAPFSLLYNYCSGIMWSLGDSRIPLLFLGISSVTNVVCDLVFILCFHMGTDGAALATVLSQGIAGFTCLVYMLKKVRFLRSGAENCKPDRKIMALLLRNGIPMALQSIVIFVGALIMQISINTLGALYVNAFAAAGKVNSPLLTPVSALGNSTGTYFGQNVGAGKAERIRQGFRVCITLSLAFSVCITVIAGLFTPQLTSLFLRDPGQELVALVKQYMLIYGPASVFLGLIYTYRPAVQAMGYASLSLIPSGLELVVRVVISIAVVPLLGFTGACFVGASAWFIAAVTLVPMGYICLGKLRRRLGQ